MRQGRLELDGNREQAERAQRQSGDQFPKPGAMALLAVIASCEQDDVKPAPRQANRTPDIDYVIGAVTHPESTLHSVELLLRETRRNIRGYAGQKAGTKRLSGICPGSVRRGSFWESRVRKQGRGSHSTSVRSNAKHIVNKRSQRASRGAS